MKKKSPKKKQKFLYVRKDIKQFRKEQRIVFEKHQEILSIKDDVYGHEVLEHYYQIKFIKMFGKNWKTSIQKIEELTEDQAQELEKLL